MMAFRDLGRGASAAGSHLCKQSSVICAGGGFAPSMRCNTASRHQLSGATVPPGQEKKPQWEENLTDPTWRLKRSALRPTVAGATGGGRVQQIEPAHQQLWWVSPITWHTPCSRAAFNTTAPNRRY